MKTALTDVFKAGLAMILGWTAAGWMLFVLGNLLALVA
jgi:hypothetical protein